MRTAVTLECARCLNPFDREVAAHLEEEFSPTVNVTTGAPLPPPEDKALSIDDRHVLDLTEAVRQYLLTTLPMKAVCSPRAGVYVRHAAQTSMRTPARATPSPCSDLSRDLARFGAARRERATVRDRVIL